MVDVFWVCCEGVYGDELEFFGGGDFVFEFGVDVGWRDLEGGDGVEGGVGGIVEGMGLNLVVGIFWGVWWCMK